MRIRLTLDIERSPKYDDEPFNDLSSSTDRAEYTNSRQIGFTREEDWTEDDSRNRRNGPPR